MMKTLLVGYDLNKAGQDYSVLIEKLKSYGAWWHHLDSTWLIKTELSASEVRDDLKKLVDSNDELLIIDVTGRARAWSGFNARGGTWLKESC